MCVLLWVKPVGCVCIVVGRTCWLSLCVVVTIMSIKPLGSGAVFVIAQSGAVFVSVAVFVILIHKL